jgi:hypothetical protein
LIWTYTIKRVKDQKISEIEDSVAEESPLTIYLNGDEKVTITYERAKGKPGRPAETKSYMWLYRTGGGDGPPIVLFDYQMTPFIGSPEEISERVPRLPPFAACQKTLHPGKRMRLQAPLPTGLIAARTG